MQAILINEFEKIHIKRSRIEIEAQKTNGRPLKTPALYKMQLFFKLPGLNFILHLSESSEKIILSCALRVNIIAVKKKYFCTWY